MRLFIAIDFPDSIQDALSASAAALRGSLESARMTRRENYHLTLVFLGEVPEARVPQVKQAMHSCSSPPVPLTIGPVQYLQRRGGGLLWRAVTVTEELARLQAGLSAALRARDFELEERAFRPHVTIARNARPAAGQPFSAPAAPALHWTAAEMTLMRSAQAEDGKRVYTPLDRTPFTGGQ